MSRQWHDLSQTFGSSQNFVGLVDPRAAGACGQSCDLVLFNVAIDSKLRGCDLVNLTVKDLGKDDRVRDRVSVIQSNTKRPVQFELTEMPVKP